MLKNFCKASIVTKFKRTNFFYYENYFIQKLFRLRVLLLFLNGTVKHWRPAKVVFLILRTLCQVPYPVEWLLLNAGALQARRCFSFLISSCLPLKINLQRIPDPPCNKSKDYLLPPITTQSIVPFFNKNNNKICDSCSQWYCSLKLPLHIYH